MKGSWAQPSLSRDFILLSAAVLFLLCFISGWVTYTAYARYSESIANELEKDGVRTDRALSEQMENANYLLTAMGKQIVIDPDFNLTQLAKMLKSFTVRGGSYAFFSWINPNQQLAVSSSRGILDKPVDVSDHDYVKKAFADPWKMVIGSPGQESASGYSTIPVAMGLTDYTGKFIGMLLIGIDVDALASRIDVLAQREDIDFAIVGKDLKPVTQASGDKDFVNHAFPAGVLLHTDFSKNPSGLLMQGSPFWGTGSYGYYRASSDYPYVILLGYDLRHGDEMMRGQLWSRLLQMLVVACFFVALLWIIRARMIRPVLEMTAVAEGVARGDVCASPPAGGPVEMEGLAMQIRRISEYLEENKRIEAELRNKMFMFKKAKEQAELDKRSKIEFLAYVCQEMRTPINTIIGAAQVMKDQLYGPIENRKYRQYAQDIYTTGNLLLDAAQNVLAQSKAEADYLMLEEKPVDVQAAIDRTLRFLADKTQVENLNVKVRLQDPMPRLVADEFRLQQIFMNLLLHIFKVTPAGTAITVSAKLVSENKDRTFFVIILSTEGEGPSSAELITLADRMVGAPHRPSRTEDLLKGQSNLSLELAKALIARHGGAIDTTQPAQGKITIAVIFAGNRIRFVEG